MLLVLGAGQGGGLRPLSCISARWKKRAPRTSRANGSPRRLRFAPPAPSIGASPSVSVVWLQAVETPHQAGRAQGDGSSGTPSAFSWEYVCSFISQPRPGRTSAHKVVRVFDAGSGPYEPDRRSVSRPSVASWRRLVRSPRSRTIGSSIPRIVFAPPSHFLYPQARLGVQNDTDGLPSRVRGRMIGMGATPSFEIGRASCRERVV